MFYNGFANIMRARRGKPAGRRGQRADQILISLDEEKEQARHLIAILNFINKPDSDRLNSAVSSSLKLLRILTTISKALESTGGACLKTSRITRLILFLATDFATTRLLTTIPNRSEPTAFFQNEVPTTDQLRLFIAARSRTLRADEAVETKMPVSHYTAKRARLGTTGGDNSASAFCLHAN
jgi:hypothetical protein